MEASYLADCGLEKEIHGVQLSLCVRTEEEGDKRVSGCRANGSAWLARWSSAARHWLL